MLLTSKLPDTALIGGDPYPINTDFRNGVLLTRAARDPQITGQEALALGVSLFFGDDPHLLVHFSEAVEATLFFYRCGQPASPAESSEKAAPPVYDFEQDAPHIWAEFFELGVDLETVSMHWWKFMALFERISTGLPYSKIVEFRGADTKGMDKQAAKYYRRMKRVYALHHPGPADPAGALTLQARYARMKQYVANRQAAQ